MGSYVTGLAAGIVAITSLFSCLFKVRIFLKSLLKIFTKITLLLLSQ